MKPTTAKQPAISDDRSIDHRQKKVRGIVGRRIVEEERSFTEIWTQAVESEASTKLRRDQAAGNSGVEARCYYTVGA